MKATGEIVDVYRICMSSQGDIWHEKSGKEYIARELDFDVKEKSFPKDDDYWTRLEHQYAGMAMQGILSNQDYLESLFLGDSREGIFKDVARCARDFALALVEKVKQEEERK